MIVESFYETQTALNQYLLLHYGHETDLLPFAFGPKESLHFPVRCVTECLNRRSLPSKASALDLGCAVGRTSFELARFCSKVVAVDQSPTFIEAAREIQQRGSLEYRILEEGMNWASRLAQLPKGIEASRVDFVCDDVMHFMQKSQQFDVVIAANLLCRLPSPLSFLQGLAQLIHPSGQLILTSPYSWLEQYTSASQWLQSGMESLHEVLDSAFELQRCFDLPFLIREHARKFQWGVSQATIWKRKTN